MRNSKTNFLNSFSLSFIKNNGAGFTLIELLVVTVIIGILASAVVMVAIRGAAEARDAKRIREVYQVAHVLHLYYSEKEEYPSNTDGGDIGCSGGWDAGSILNEEDTFIAPLIAEGFLSFIPIEQKPTGSSDWEKCSYRYIKTDNPCGGCVGTYAILYAVCETDNCPAGERPSCCTDDQEGGPTWDARDIAIFLKEQ